MAHQPEVVEILKLQFAEATTEINHAVVQLATAAGRISKPQARRYLTEGVQRRLYLIERCIRNVFRLFPLDQHVPLPTDVVQDVNINLHAFLINCTGVLDNLAWAYLIENDCVPKQRVHVALHKHKTIDLLPTTLRNHLKSDRMSAWFSTYFSDYRDTLAHRIPFFVPPAEYTEEERMQDHLLASIWREEYLFGDAERADEIHEERSQLGRASLSYFHFDGSNDKVEKAMFLHPQMLKDTHTVCDLVMQFVKCDFHT